MKRFIVFPLLVAILITIGGGLIYDESPQAFWHRAGNWIKGLAATQTVAAISATPVPVSTPLAIVTERVAGPYRWRNVEIGGTGFVTGVIFHPKAPGVVYARTDIGGAYRWNPETKRWISLEDWVSTDEWSLLGVESLAIDPEDAQRVYLAAGTYTNSWAGNGVILSSTDQGRSWGKNPVPFKFGGNEDGRSIGERLAVDPHLGSILLLGTRHNGLWRSEDHGRTWRQVTSFPEKGSAANLGIGFILFDEKSGGKDKPTKVIYAGVLNKETSLYRSTDAGATWSEVPGQPKGFLPHHGVLTRDSQFYLTYSNNPGPNGIIDGAVWNLDTASGKWTEITPVKPGANGVEKFGYTGITVDASDPKTVLVSTMDRWGSGDTIFRSTDGGAQWTDLSKQAVIDPSATPYIKWGHDKVNFGHWIGDLEINPFNRDEALYCTGQGLWSTEDLTAEDAGKPTHWAVHTQGIEETSVNCLISPPSGTPLISGLLDVAGFRHDDLSVSPKSGIWTNPIMNSVSSLDFAQGKPDLVVRVGTCPNEKAHGAVSLDGAKTWHTFGNEPKINGNDAPRSIAVAADGGSLVWIAQDGLAYVSKDLGDSWHRCGGIETQCARVISDRVNPKVFYALPDDKRSLFTSKDGGESFTLINSSLPDQATELRATAITESDLWLTAGNNGLWRSHDHGAHFSKVDGVPAAEVIGFGKAAPGEKYDAIYLVGKIGDAHGIFRSDDEAATWKRINDDQHRFGWIGKCITGDPKTFGRVYLATNGRGIIYGDPTTKEDRRASH